MGKYSEYVLISDMDGTLLTSERKVSLENRAAIQRFTEGGGNFCVATGRIPQDAIKLLDGLPITTACVFYNGAMLYDCKEQKPVKEFFLEGEKWHEFAQVVANEFRELCIQIFTPEGCFVVTPWHKNNPWWDRITYQHIFCDMETVLDKAWIKMMVHGEDAELMKKMVLRAREMGMDQLSNSFYAADDCYEFVPPGTSKGHMLKYLRELSENQGRRIIAQGDHGNDTYMLQMADVGVAAGNAFQETKEAADIVGVNCNDHLAAYVIGLIDAGKIN